MQLYDDIDIDVDPDALEYLKENDLRVSNNEEYKKNPAWLLRDSIVVSRPYTLSDFERKYFIPNL